MCDNLLYRNDCICNRLKTNSLYVNEMKYPTVDGSFGQVLTTNGNNVLMFKPIISTTTIPVADNSIVRYDGTSGKLIQDSQLKIFIVFISFVYFFKNIQ